MERTASEKPVNVNSQKPTYDELKNYCAQLGRQNSRLKAMVEKQDLFNMFKRLDYLFTVLQTKDVFDSGFVSCCVAEIKQALTVEKESQAKEGADVPEPEKGE